MEKRFSASASDDLSVRRGLDLLAQRGYCNDLSVHCSRGDEFKVERPAFDKFYSESARPEDEEGKQRPDSVQIPPDLVTEIT